MQAQPFRLNILASRFGAGLIAGLMAALAVLPAHASEAAESFVQERANEVMAIINNSSYSVSQKKDEVADIIDQFIDVERIAMFTLGKYRSQGSDEYIEAFREYLIEYYVTQLSLFEGLTLEVTGSQDLGPRKGTVVISTATRADEPEPVEVNWRVVDDTSIIDVEIEGVWMAQTLREQVVSAIDQNDGQISAAIDLLHELANLDS